MPDRGADAQELVLAEVRAFLLARRAIGDPVGVASCDQLLFLLPQLFTAGVDLHAVPVVTSPVCQSLLSWLLPGGYDHERHGGRVDVSLAWQAAYLAIERSPVFRECRQPSPTEKLHLNSCS